MTLYRLGLQSDRSIRRLHDTLRPQHENTNESDSQLIDPMAPFRGLPHTTGSAGGC